MLDDSSDGVKGGRLVVFEVGFLPRLCLDCGAFVLAFGGLAGIADFFAVERNPVRTVAITAVLRCATESHSGPWHEHMTTS